MGGLNVCSQPAIYGAQVDEPFHLQAVRDPAQHPQVKGLNHSKHFHKNRFDKIFRFYQDEG